MVDDTIVMRPSVAAVSVLAVVLVSGCAAVRNRLLPGSLGPPVEVPEEAKPLGHFLRGQVALSHNDVASAVKEFEQAIAEDPSTPWLRLRLAQLYVRQGQAERALEQCQQVVAA